MQDPLAERLNAGGDLLLKIMSSGVIKTIGLAIGGVFVYALFENRAEAVRIVFTSAPIMVSLGVGGLLSVVGYLFKLSLAKTEEANRKNETFKDLRIQELQQELAELKTELKTELKGMQAFAVSAISKHNEILAVLQEMKK